jgi:glycosyltransferase involved in cell wall biosynthesis
MATGSTSVTVGIPAYNEEANIKNLLESIMSQRRENFVLEKILVVSDGSTDATASIVRQFSDPLVELVEFKLRQGLAAGQNEIVRRAESDILVLLDADVLPTSADCLEELIRPILSGTRVGLTSAETVSAPPRGFFERVIAFSHELKVAMYKQINDGANIYLCHGRCRAFAKSLYKNLHWPVQYSEDAFSYLSCLKSGFQFVFTPRAGVLFRCPDNLSDHVKQSRRFMDGKRQMEKYFAPEFVRKEYRIPFFITLRTSLLYFLKNPVKLAVYAYAYLYARFFPTYNPASHSLFEISASSKKVLL